MSSTSVSILVPLMGPAPELPATLEAIEQYLHGTGLEFDVRVLDSRDGDDYGARIRRGASEAKGSVVVIVDPRLAYPVSAIGDAVALIESGSAEVVFGNVASARYAPLRWLLVPILPDPALHLKAFSANAARLLIGESTLSSAGYDLEIAYLANKYGFRIESLRLRADADGQPSFDVFTAIRSAITIRLTDRNNGYRAPRRCPVCFSSEVWSWAQIPDNVVRACSRCKSRYLNQFDATEEVQPVRRELRAHAPTTDLGDETAHARTARQKTSLSRLSSLRKHVASRARILEIGVRDGAFGSAAS